MACWQRILLLPLVAPALGAYDIAWGDDSDLTSFVTRPEIRVPKFNVQVHNPASLTPGYWFIAPYAHVQQHVHAPRYLQSCQTGPSIYDNNGELVWSGACMVRNQNTFDFRTWTFNGTQYMSALHSGYPDLGDRRGHGIILNESYSIVQNVSSPSTLPGFNMHELNVIDEGRKALYLLWDPVRLPLWELNLNGVDSGWVADMGFHEIDLTTGEVLFEWWANRAGHVSLNESRQAARDLDGPWPKAWNWFHGNSIEKNSEGDYILSSRYTDTIYKISGENGAVIWRLGGQRSSFTQDFSFSGQHDARTQYIDDKVEILSFLNNNSDDNTQIANTSVALVVELHRRDMTARVISEIPRPDGNLTRLRGNHQILPNGNHFIHWSENSYITEHSPKGEMIMEAKFESLRFVNYRAYKLNFTGNPNEAPVAVAHVHGTSSSKSSTAIYVSWNGVTEVSSWKFYGHEKGTTNDPLPCIGEAKKTGFETVFYVDGYYSTIYVEGLDDGGYSLGASSKVHAVVPKTWSGKSTEGLMMQQRLGKTGVSRHAEYLSPSRTISMAGISSSIVYILGAVELLICLILGVKYFGPRRGNLMLRSRVMSKETWS